MASIYPRSNKNSVVWRLVLRRKGIKTLCLCFATREEAEKWALENELNFILNPDKYHEWADKNRLINYRLRSLDR